MYCNVYVSLLIVFLVSNVDAIWMEWTNWSTCSVSCGTGYHVRSRICSVGLDNCTGSNYDTKHCQKDPCPVNAIWMEWTNWSTCSVSCGIGYHVRSRICSVGLDNCTGSNHDTKHCQKDPCPVDGGWSEWTQYSKCSSTCGSASRQRLRECNKPSPSNGGKDCIGSSTELQDCTYIDCLDGLWTSWSDWSQCSSTCGNSTRIRLRTCTLSSLNGTCVGSPYERDVCTIPCPIDGGWSDWGSWSNCTSRNNCGQGTHERSRLCKNPMPAFGGKNCGGLNNEMSNCSVPCPEPVHCPSSTWIIYKQSCYYFSTSSHNWGYSGNWCNGFHATLAQINSREEQTFIEQEAVKKFGNSAREFWLDGNDKDTEGNWTWRGTSQSIGTYLNWHKDEPSGNIKENCLSLKSSTNYTWHDSSCDSNFLFICEKSGHSSNITNVFLPTLAG